MRAWLLFWLLTIVATPLHAQGYATCVEQQRAAIAQITGASDSAGRLTQDRLDGLGLPALSDATQYQWCRALGDADPELRAFWPSAQEHIVLWVPPRLRGGGAEAISRRALEDARAFFATAYNLELVGGFAFLSGDDPSELERAAKARRRARGQSAAGMFAKPMPCGPESPPRAIAFRDIALFCWPAVPPYDAAWVDKNQKWWTRVFVHEYAHGLQNELAGTDWRGRLPSGEWALGPKWLVEGAAEVLEEEYFAQHPRFKERSIGKQKRIIARSDKTLSDLRTKVVGTEDYDVSQFAADLLGHRFGRAALLDYFKAVRGAPSLTAAFQQTFGMSLEEYEAKFETLRNNLVAAHEFGKGE